MTNPLFEKSGAGCVALKPISGPLAKKAQDYSYKTVATAATTYVLVRIGNQFALYTPLKGIWLKPRQISLHGVMSKVQAPVMGVAYASSMVLLGSSLARLSERKIPCRQVEEIRYFTQDRRWMSYN